VVARRGLTGRLTQRRRDAERTDINSISGAIVDAAFHIHRTLGPGLLESVYEVVLAHELEKRGLRIERQKPVPIEFEGLHTNLRLLDYRLGLLINFGAPLINPDYS
jgi:iron complex transport system substrate-binding protein